MNTKIDRCENQFCLYWRNSRCLLSYLTLDNAGCCENCVFVELPEGQLKKAREMQLKKLEEI